MRCAITAAVANLLAGFEQFTAGSEIRQVIYTRSPKRLGGFRRLRSGTAFGGEVISAWISDQDAKGGRRHSAVPKALIYNYKYY